MIDQWRMAFGLTALIMSMFTLSKAILGIQAAFMIYMVFINGKGFHNYLGNQELFLAVSLP